MKEIPSLESASQELVRLNALHESLMAQGAALDEQMRSLHAQLGTEQAADRHGDRVAALLAGIQHQPPAPVRDQIAAVAKEQQAVGDAIRELSGKIRIERERASRLIVVQFADEWNALATEFFRHVAAAADAHARFGEIRRQFHRAGVDPAGFMDFGADIFGDPGHRNGNIGIALRAAVRRGNLKERELPEAFK